MSRQSQESVQLSNQHLETPSRGIPTNESLQSLSVSCARTLLTNGIVALTSICIVTLRTAPKEYHYFINNLAELSTPCCTRLLPTELQKVVFCLLQLQLRSKLAAIRKYMFHTRS